MKSLPVQWRRAIFGFVIISIVFIVLNYAERHRKQTEGTVQSFLKTETVKCNDCGLQKSESQASSDDKIKFADVLKGPIQQDDPRLLKFIQKKYLIAPSKDPYNLVTSNTNINPAMKGQSDSNFVETILNYTKMRDGFFIEADVADGETNSQTLSLEKDHGWSGLLIEPASEYFNLLRQKNRKAWIVNSCVSHNPFPYQVEVEMKTKRDTEKSRSNQSESEQSPHQNSTMLILQCFPIFSLIKAVTPDISTVDFLSLNVNGRELDVLTTIPFQSVLFKMISVSVTTADPEQVDLILKFVSSNDFVLVTRVIQKSNFGTENYLLLVHASVSTVTNDTISPVTV